MFTLLTGGAVFMETELSEELATTLIKKNQPVKNRVFTIQRTALNSLFYCVNFNFSGK